MLGAASWSAALLLSSGSVHQGARTARLARGSSSNDPCIACTSMYEVYSPRPVPSPGGLVVANGSNSRCAHSRIDAGAVVFDRDAHRAVLPSCAARRRGCGRPRRRAPRRARSAAGSPAPAPGDPDRSAAGSRRGLGRSRARAAARTPANTSARARSTTAPSGTAPRCAGAPDRRPRAAPA